VNEARYVRRAWRDTYFSILLMESTQPTFRYGEDLYNIRTFEPTGDATSDGGGSGASVIERDDELSDDATTAKDRLDIHKQHIVLERERRMLKETWTEVVTGPVTRITRPAASRFAFINYCFRHRLLHPAIYRTVGGVNSLDELASQLGAPADWEAKFFEMWKPAHHLELSRFATENPNQLEQDSESYFQYFCDIASTYLGIQDHARTRDHTKVICGGFLAEEKYDYISVTDKAVKFSLWRYIIGSEAKRKKMFPLGSIWYSGSKGVQVYAALYSLNCPVI
jgi:hypothetical protein